MIISAAESGADSEDSSDERWHGYKLTGSGGDETTRRSNGHVKLAKEARVARVAVADGEDKC